MTELQVHISDAMFAVSALAMLFGAGINVQHSPGNPNQHLRLRPNWRAARRLMNAGISIAIAACVYQTILWIIDTDSFYTINVPIRCIHFGISMVIYFWYIRPGYLIRRS